jgi:hypothetical protein
LPNREAADVPPSGIEDVARLILGEAGEKRVRSVPLRELELFLEQRNDLVETDEPAVSKSAIARRRSGRHGMSQQYPGEGDIAPERSRRVAVLDGVSASEPGFPFVRVPGELPEELDRPHIGFVPIAGEQQEELGVLEAPSAFRNGHRPLRHPARHELVEGPSHPGWNVMYLDAR